MPVMGGIEAARTIRKINQKIPILALTAAASKENVDQCLSAGMSDFLSKPVDPEKLKEEMDKLKDELKELKEELEKLKEKGI